MRSFESPVIDVSPKTDGEPVTLRKYVPFLSRPQLDPVQAQISSLHERTAALVERSEGGVGRNSFDKVVDVVSALRLLRRLDPEDIHRVRRAPVDAHYDPAKEWIVDR